MADTPAKNSENKSENPSNSADDRLLKTSEEQTAIEREQEALRKARDLDAEGYENGEGEAMYANLHFGDQKDAENKDGFERNPDLDSAEPAQNLQESRFETQGGSRSSTSATGNNDQATKASSTENGENSAGTLNADSGVDESAGRSDSTQASNAGPQNVAGQNSNSPSSQNQNSAEDVDGLEVNKKPVNEGPTDIELSSASVDENASGATVATLSSTDPDAGDTATYSIAEDSSGLFEVVGNELRLKDGVSLDHEGQDSYDLTLQVVDGAGVPYTKTVTINVADLNEGPTDIALSGTSVDENTLGMTVATLSSMDPDAGDTATYSIAEDSSGLFEVVGSELKLKDGVSLDHEGQDSYELILQVVDGAGVPYTETVTINVADLNEGPTDIALSGTSVDENASGVTVATLSSTDPDAGDSASYSISDDASGLFEVVGNELKLKDGVSLDHEGQDSYELTLQVTDGAGVPYIETVTINVADLNEGPTDIALSGTSVNENAFGATVATLSSTDPDSGDTGTYSITEDSSGLFEVVGNELRLKEGVSLDHEGQDSYELTLQVVDGAGVPYTEVVTINVADLNEGPTDIALSGTSVSENTAGAVVGTLSSFDPDAGDSVSYSVSDDRFEIVGDQLKLKDGQSLNHEDVSSLDIVVTATDAEGLSTTENFTIDVTNLNEGPSLGLASQSGLQASYYDVGHSIRNLNEVDFDATPDAQAVVDSIDHMQGNEKFWEDGPDSYFAARYEGQLVVEEGGSYTINMASDDGSMLFIDGEPVLDNDGLHGTRTRSVTLDLDEGSHDIEIRYFENGGAQTLQLSWSGPDTGGVNQVIEGEAFSHGYSENALSLPEDEAGATVAVLTVTDPDVGDSHTFTVDDDRFEVAEEDGSLVLKLKDGVSVDHELESALEVGVTVTDAAGASDTATYSIAVGDTNTAPDITLNEGLGLQASYYDVGHSIRNLNEVDFDATPDAQAVVDSIDHMQGNEKFWEDGPDSYFAARYEGQLVVEKGGSYTINMASDDGSMLFIDGEPVLDNDGLHGTRTRSVTLDLDEGSHDIEIRYFENGGAQTLQLSWSGPDTGGANQVISGTSFNVPGFDPDATLSVSENVIGQQAALLSITDAEGDAITYSVDDDRFELIETDDGYALKLKDGVSIDHEAFSEVSLTITATDEHGESSSQDYTVSVNDVNEGPTDIALSGTSVNENASGATVATLSSSDPDAGDSTTYSITDDASGLFEVVGNELKLKDGVSLDHEGQDSYELTVQVTDSGGASYSETVTINVADINEKPTDLVLEPASTSSGAVTFNTDGGNDDAAIAANVEAFPTDALTVEVTFTSSQTDVGSGVPLFSYAASSGHNNEALIWLESSSGDVNIFLAGQKINTGIPNSSLLDGEQHQVSFTWDQASNELKVYVDGEAEFSSTINIRDLKTDGTVAFGQEQDAEGGRFDTRQIFEGEIAEVRIFDHARSSDEIADNTGGTLANPQGEAGLVSNWVMGQAEGGVVPDLAGNNDLVLVNDASVVEGAPSDNPIVYENEAGAIVGTLSSTDPDAGDTATYSITDDASGLFEVVGNELKLKDGVSLDHEGQDSYELTVQVTDSGGASHSKTITINVADINEGPTDIALSGTSVDENASGATVATLSSTDPDAGDSAAYSISDDASGLFEVVGNELKLKDGVSLDHEGQDSYELTLQVTDGDGAAYTEVVNINVADLNEGPTDIELSSTSIDENASGATVATLSSTDPDAGDSASYSISQDASGLFEVVGNELKLKDGVSLDHEGQESYELTVQVTDSGGASYSETVTINVADVNEAPTDITFDPLLSTTVEAAVENGDIKTGNGGGEETSVISLTDPESAEIVIDFARADNSFELEVNGESLTGGTIQLEHAHYDEDTQSFLQFEDGNAISQPWVPNDDGSSRIKIVITEDGVQAFATRTPSSGELEPLELVNGEFTAPNLIDGDNNVKVINPDEGGPDGVQATISATNEGDTYTVVEAGTETVVGTLSAVDPDTGDTATFSVADDPSGLFEVVGNELKVKAGVSLDYESQDSHTIMLQVEDSSGAVYQEEITINVADINETPTDITLTNSSVAENLVGATVGTLSSTDSDTGDTAAYTITDDPSGLFEVVGNELKVKAGAALDFEAQESHDVTLSVEDSAGNVYTETVTINVADIAEMNIITGTDNNDRLRGTAGEDRILGGDGNDIIQGNAGADELIGGAGNDRIYADGDDTVVSGGEGNDRVIVQGDGDFSLDMNAAGVERVDGGKGDDNLDASGMTGRATQLGKDGDDTLTGGDGNDVQRGGSGNDIISGGDGNDNIRGDAGADQLIGGAGNDRIYADSDDTVVSGGEGNDRVIVQGKGDFSLDMNAAGVERVDGGKGDDNLDASGMTGRATQLGKGGDDTLTGGAGNDVQRGGSGDDVISGGDGNDNIRGDAGADQLMGGAGNDRIYADSDDTVVSGGEGNDRVIVQGDGDFSLNMNEASVERVDGGKGDDSLDASGMTDRAVQLGNDGDDTLIGGAGNDVQRGGSGDDTIFGGEGRDNIRGDAGDDQITGGAGNDRMYGGDGADVFVYEMGDGSDQMNGGAGGGWTDTIQFSDGIESMGEFGVDWTIELTEGSITSADADGIVFTDDADGTITFSDGATIDFVDMEQII